MRNPARALLLTTTLALLLVPAAGAEYLEHDEGQPECQDLFCTTSIAEPGAASVAGGGAVGFLALGALAVLATVLAVRLR